MEDVVVILLLVAVQGISYWFKKKREAEGEVLSEEVDTGNVDSLPEELIPKTEAVPLEVPKDDQLGDLAAAYQDFLLKQEHQKKEDKKVTRESVGAQHNHGFNKPSASDLQKAVIWAEILGPCRAHRSQKS